MSRPPVPIRPIRSVLVPVDGSEDARRAAVVAAQLAAPHGAALTLLHVYAVPVVAGLGQRALDHERVNEEAAKASLLVFAPVREALETAAAEGLYDASALSVREERVEQGDPATEILDIAIDEDFDLLVVGTRGLGRLKGLLMGSVSAKIASLAPCPVVVVP